MSEHQVQILSTTMSMGNTDNVVIYKLDISAERFEALAEEFKSTELAAGIPALENDDSEDKGFKRLIAQSDPSSLRDSKFAGEILQNLSKPLVGRITTDYQDSGTVRLNARINDHIRSKNHV